MEKELQVTPASEFRRMREKGVSLTLITGRQIRMSGVDPSHFVRDPEFKAGTWPKIFMDLIIDMFWNGDYSARVDKFLEKRESPSEMADLMISMGIVAKKVLLEPVVVDTPQTDDDAVEIALSDLHPTELTWITRLAFERHQVLFWLEEHGVVGAEEDNDSDAGAPVESKADGAGTTPPSA